MSTSPCKIWRVIRGGHIVYEANSVDSVMTLMYGMVQFALRNDLKQIVLFSQNAFDYIEAVDGSYGENDGNDN